MDNRSDSDVKAMSDEHCRTKVVGEYLIYGNKFLSIAINVSNPSDANYFDIDPKIK